MSTQHWTEATDTDKYLKLGTMSELMKDQTLMILAGAGLLGYVLYRASPAISRSGEGIADVFSGAGNLAGQITRTTELVPALSEGLQSSVLRPVFSTSKQVLGDVGGVAGDITSVARKASSSFKTVYSAAADKSVSQAQQAIRESSSLSQRSGFASSTASTKSVRIPVSGGYVQLGVNTDKVKEGAQKAVDLVKKVVSVSPAVTVPKAAAKVASIAASQAKKAVAKVSTIISKKVTKKK